MERLKKIPVIGYLGRLLVGLIKLPKHISIFYQAIEKSDRQDLEIIHALEDQQKRVDELVQELGKTNKHIDDLKNVNVSSEYLKRLNILTSTTPTIWGKEERLHISDLAAVFTCTLNTNSGHITVGDYTFAGSGVSILAGGHDKNLTGLLRRDAELTDGCDIVIGNGVWLASNCTILGPATIGDDAVIAAGAVVLPGTNVPAGAIYGGIPAKCIGNIDVNGANDMDSSAVQKAMLRNDGILFAKGFGEKKNRICNAIEYVGRFLVGGNSEIYTDQSELNFVYKVQEGESVTLTVKGKEITYFEQELTGDGRFDIQLNESGPGKMCQVILCRDTENVELFLALVQKRAG